MKFTKHTLKKIEGLFDEIEYTIRYERGNFQSGYCIVQNKQIAVINKYYDTEGRINCLLDILQSIEIEEDQLEEKTAKFYRQLMKYVNLQGTEKEEESSN